MNPECRLNSHPERGKFTRFFFLSLLSQVPWTQNVLCELARRKQSGFTVHVIWKAGKETFKLLFKQVSFQLLLSSLSKPIILSPDMAIACWGDGGIWLHIFLSMFSFLVAFGCGLFYSVVVDFHTAASATDLLLHGHKMKWTYTGKGALLHVKYWAALLHMVSVSQAETCLLSLLKDAVTLCFVTSPT